MNSITAQALIDSATRTFNSGMQQIQECIIEPDNTGACFLGAVLYDRGIDFDALKKNKRDLYDMLCQEFGGDIYFDDVEQIIYWNDEEKFHWEYISHLITREWIEHEKVG